MKRKPISKRTRFEVLKRDGFRCRYCGATSDEAKLVVDHFVPASRNGHESMRNYITACVDCNRGKSDVPIDVSAWVLDLPVSNMQEAVKDAILKDITMASCILDALARWLGADEVRVVDRYDNTLGMLRTPDHVKPGAEKTEICL